MTSDRRRRSPRREVGAVERLQGRGVSAIAVIVLRGGAIGEIAVALCLVSAQRADPLHIAEQQRLRAAEAFGADAELLQHHRQLVGGVLAVTDQLFQIVGCDPQIVRDPVEIGAIELPYLVQLAAMLQPARKGVDEVLDDGLRPACGAHGKLPSDGGIGAN